MTQIRYLVRKAFKYGKIHLKPGDEFIPAGGKFDEQIMKSQLVYADTQEFAPPARHAWRNKRGHAKYGKRGIGGNFEAGVPLKGDTPKESRKRHKPKAEVIEIPPVILEPADIPEGGENA